MFRKKFPASAAIEEFLLFRAVTQLKMKWKYGSPRSVKMMQYLYLAKVRDSVPHFLITYCDL